MSTPVSGVLTDTISGQPIANEPVTLQLDNNESCQALTDTTGTATCNVTPSEPEGTYPLTGAFAGDTSQPLQLMPSNGQSNFVVTPDATSLTYTGATTGVNGQALAVSGVLTRVFDGAPIAGRNVTFTLGTGSSSQTCSAVTNATGAVACSIASLNQSPGPIPVTDKFAGDNYYLPASAASTVNLPEGTQLTVNPTGGHLQRVHTHHGHADQHLHQPAGAERTGHLHGERHADVHGYDQRQRRRPPAPSRRPSHRVPTR